MFNIEESWNTANAFPFPLPHHSMLRHFGDMLKTSARLNIARGSGGSHFPPETLECFKTFLKDCKCAENWTPQDHVRCVMVYYDTYKP